MYWLSLLGMLLTSMSVQAQDELHFELQGASEGAMMVMATDGTRILSHAGGWLKLFDAADPDPIEPLGRYWLGERPMALALQGDLAFVVQQDVFRIFSIADPQLPEELGSLSLDPIGYSLAVSGSLAVIGGWDGEVLLVNVSDHGEMLVEANLQLGGPINDLQIQGTLLFVADHSEGLSVYETGDPVNLELISSLPELTAPNALSLEGDRLLVARQWEGMSLVDISDPYQPELLLELREQADQVCLFGDLALAVG